MLIINLYFGLRYAKNQRTTETYFAARGRVPAWAIGMSLLATLISSVTFLGYPSEGYSSNWILLVQGLMVPIVLLGTIWFIVPLYRKVIGLSTYEYFEKRFGAFARYYSSTAFVLRQFSSMGTVFFLLSVALTNMTGADTFYIIVIVGLIIIAVNLLGGIEAVIWLDVFQGFMLFASGILCVVVIIYSVKGGFSEVINTASANNRTGFGPYDVDFTRLTFVVMVINGAFYAIQKYGTDQTVVQRYLTAKTDQAAIRASILGISLTVPVWALFMFIGTALYVYYKQQPLPQGMRPDAVFPYFIMTKFPTGVVGFILAAMISAAICSLSADLNSLAAVGLEDFYKKARPARTDKEYLMVSKGIVVFSGIIAIGIGAIYLQAGNEGVLGIVFTLYAIFSGGIVGIFLLGIFSARANKQGVNIAIVVCIVFTAYAFLTSTQIGYGDNKKLLLDLGDYNFTHHKLMLGVYSHLVVIGVGYVASLFFPKPKLDTNLLYSGWRNASKAPSTIEGSSLTARNEDTRRLEASVVPSLQKLGKATVVFLLLGFSLNVAAQTADNQFKKPLNEIISEIETRYSVKIRYPQELVKDKYVTYADWRFRPADVEKTMTNILASQDITFAKEGDKKYKLQAFQYHLKTPEEGQQQLDYLASLYTDIASWEKRKSELRACMWEALKLSHLPARPTSQPIITNKRTYDGYTVENVAIETLPGLYVTGSLYKPLNAKGLMPVILNPDGHFGDGRYRADCQYRCAMQARMGAMAFSYDLFAWGESALQVKPEDHRRSLAQTIQVVNGMRSLDWLLTLKNADPKRVAISGGSGGGSQTMLLTALDDRIILSVPVVMLSSYHSGGCPCESGMGVHLCGSGTNNVEIAAMAAPRLQLAISDGKDWTQHVPETEFPFLQRIYGFYGKTDVVKNVHLPQEGHDYGISKRLALYDFLAQNFALDLKKADESKCTIEQNPAMYVFGEKGENLPANAIRRFEDVEKLVQ
ncbi:sodium:solute symporter [Spirosoma arboris]|uniref:sodium:solute symporter n=1 Tax=Spirosoma arboris TaxID=2682092 RepID=UPI001D111486|nr:sodium:solute symporter [Spirosoma arboris]